MAVHYAFFTTPDVVKSVPCLGESIPLGELKDAIAAPLEAALKGRRLREKFELRVYYADTKEEIVGESSRVRNHACVHVKRVPAHVMKQARKPSVPVVPASLSNKTTQVSESIVTDDGFGDDVYSCASIVTSEGVEKGPVVVVESVRTVKNMQKVRDRETIGSVQKVRECNKQRDEVACRSEVAPVQSQIPQELMCFLCKNVMKDPMLIRCCCNTFCGECIKVALGERKRCPKCESCKCGVADLLPNRHIALMVDGFVRSNPSVASSSSSGSCSSTLTICSLAGPSEIQLTRGAASDTVQKTRAVDGVSGKRKPLVIQLNSRTKKTKVM